jgi:hypothetical protein
MTDDETIAMLNELFLNGRLVATIDKEGEPFLPVTMVTMSSHTEAEIAAGKQRKFIMWLDADAAITDGEDLYR